MSKKLGFARFNTYSIYSQEYSLMELPDGLMASKQEVGILFNQMIFVCRFVMVIKGIC